MGRLEAKTVTFQLMPNKRNVECFAIVGYPNIGRREE